ncbi:protease inhibitor I9 family protein [Streptomyces sp. NBC_00503]|uniref:protease inhibitor I9 family protein n=1 Tax=Streptomyces sp. NBC_00503 TaxID=2903659 RepID=UPI002E811D16|nr:protease inhibitor I9 family protein [Streptomyces sp. NBC_00503]WUD82080.1 protease inhibitor I9 family protein [Streptomyces sp. NBC_00503]
MRTRPSWTLPTAVAALALTAVAALPAHAATTTAASPGPAPASRAAAPTPAEWPAYVVTVHPGLDPAAVADAYGITPIHVYRNVLNGFSARLSPEQVEALRTTAVVESVEKDGTASASGPAAF